MPPALHWSPSKPVAPFSGALSRPCFLGHLALGFALTYARTLVVELLAARQTALGHLAHQPLDLAAVKEELALALWVVIGVAAVVVRSDVAPHQPGLAVVDGGVAVLEVHLGFAERLDLRTPQHDARLVRLQDLVVVERLAIARHHLVSDHGVANPARLLTSQARSVS